MNVLSLFNGIGCAAYSLKKVGIPIENLYVSEIDKYANIVNDKNHSESVQLGCVKALWERRFDSDISEIFSSIDLLVGGSPCFAAGTKVLTNTGYKNVEDVNVGDMVLTHKNRYRKVLKKGGDIKETLSLSAQAWVQ